MNLATTFFQFGTECILVAGVAGIGWILTIYCLLDKYDKEKDKPVDLVKDIVNATFAVVTLVAAVTIAINFTFHFPDSLFGKVDNIARLAESIDEKPDPNFPDAAKELEPTLKRIENLTKAIGEKPTPEIPDVGKELEQTEEALKRIEDLAKVINDKPAPKMPDVAAALKPVNDTLGRIEQILATPKPTTFSEEVAKLHRNGTLGNAAIANAEFSKLVRRYFNESLPHFMQDLRLNDGSVYFSIDGIDDFKFSIKSDLTGEVFSS